MKAIRLSPTAAIVPVVAIISALAAGCVPAARTPVAPPPAVAVPVRRPVPIAAPADWRDAPQTPGDWTWASEAGRSTARFAGERLIVRCDADAGTITLTVAATGPSTLGATGADAGLAITTGSGTRTLPVTTAGFARQAVLSARDPLLDAMAFSRGRFMVAAPGIDPLFVPSWPELGRVIEDCR